ncbi:hypothetical protein Anapl_07620 [Anas platyrhynchos]|uniref:Uncharacterized protein n=1 Tax=Anas platyrhynchos TaxID=8839 RepID=R0JMV4_ANAPL|nr:hypothetical protein Anapl_07620 [Anas platyrhynchos]
MRARHNAGGGDLCCSSSRGAPGRGCTNTQREPVHAELDCFKHTCAASQQTPSEPVGTVITGGKLGSKQSHQRRHLRINAPGKGKVRPTFLPWRSPGGLSGAGNPTERARSRGCAPGQQKDHVQKHLAGIAQP